MDINNETKKPLVDWSVIQGQLQQAKTQPKSTCPNCGHCPHCGRSNQTWSPYWYQPYYGPQFTWTGSATTVSSQGHLHTSGYVKTT